ncbi:MAG: UDP-N-acetylmuramoyl-tripeptide--D-alanyl-D-alanine ligase [Patescibacteria group bacterium]
MKRAFRSIIVAILTFEAALLLRRKTPTIIAVTGSVGKTSTKDAIYAAIKQHKTARKSEKSFNSDIGVPLTVLGLPNGWSNPFIWLRNILDGFLTACFSRSYPEVLILEAGIDQPGDMQHLTAWIQPSIVVLTRLPDVPVHVEYFSSPEAVVAEKLQLVSALRSDGVLVYNHDDPIIERHRGEFHQRQIGFSRYLESDVTARGDRIKYQDDRPVGVSCNFQVQGQEYVVDIADTIGTQHVYSVGAALGVAHALGLPIEQVVQSLKSLRTPNGRMRLVPGIKGTTLIDDSYNSSPIAAEQALQAVGELRYAKRKIVVLGDMLELGKYANEEHKRIGSLVPRVADRLLTVGVRARGIAAGALQAGMDEACILQYDESRRAGYELQQLIEPGDVILVKGSQSVRTERIVEEVMAEPERAEELLVRHDTGWLRIA